MYMNGWSMGGMWIFWLAGIVLLVVVAVILARTLQGPREESNSSERILKERYAGGEISKQEYDRMLAEIHR
ncbi:MAG: SHOCT domain-containing protein [Bryobacterales bacterium]